MRWIIFGVFIVIVGLGIVYLARPAKQIEQVYAVSYADRMAVYMGLDPDMVYRDMLDDLQVKKIRLAAYWDEIEPVQGQYNFDRLDYLMNEADKRDAKVVLAVGRKLPRWPECYAPEWSKDPKIDQSQAVLSIVETVVRRYDNHPALVEWQLENEPFVGWFGDCPAPDKDLLIAERDLIRSISDKQIVITDSGELSTWYKAAKFGDVFGTTLYRVTWNEIFGYGVYPLPPSAYRLKARIWGLDPNAVVVSELQAEPWPPGIGLMDATIDEQLRSMDINRMQEQVEFAKATNFKEVWLWGVEWWYWMKQNGHPEFWEKGKEIFVKP